jgi:hypothetical protein
VHPWAIVVHYSGLATLVVWASCLVGEWPDLAALSEPTSLLLLLGVGVAATLGQVCVTRAFTAGPPASVSVVGLTQIIFALGLDLLFTGPCLQPLTLAGIALVLAPTAWVMAQRSSRENRPSGRREIRRVDARSGSLRPYYSVDGASAPVTEQKNARTVVGIRERVNIDHPTPHVVERRCL